MEQFRTTTVILLTVLVMLVSMIATAVIIWYLPIAKPEPPIAMELQKLIQVQLDIHPEPATLLQAQPQAQQIRLRQRLQPSEQTPQPEGREKAPYFFIFGDHLFKGWVRQQTKA